MNQFIKPVSKSENNVADRDFKNMETRLTLLEQKVESLTELLHASQTFKNPELAEFEKKLTKCHGPTYMNMFKEIGKFTLFKVLDITGIFFI